MHRDIGRFASSTVLFLSLIAASTVGLATPAGALSSGAVLCDSPDYSCATGGYNYATAQSSGWPWSSYGGPWPSYNSYGPHNCTLYAAYKLEQNGVTLNWSDNASGWAIDAAQRGVLVNGSPAVGSIAQWNSGHVAYVEAVGPDYIITTDDNYGYNHTTEQRRSPGYGWPDNFIHFRDQGGGGTSGPETAFQANTGILWSIGVDNHGPWGLGMKNGTSPAITSLGSGYQVAFQANTGSLWTVGVAGNRDWGLGMMAGTSPAITSVGFGYEVAFQGKTGSLWTVGVADNRDWGLGMMAGTSPSVTALTTGGFEVAVQANTGNLWTVGAAGNRDWGLGMMAGTSPAISLSR